MREPWSGLNPMQVVGAVGFAGNRLAIPEGVDAIAGKICEDCWLADSRERPSFVEIQRRLKPLKMMGQRGAGGGPGWGFARWNQVDP
jgi:hypothetical protein